MNGSKYKNSLWSYCTLSEGLRIESAPDFDPALFFNRCLATGMTLAEAAGAENHTQVEIIETGIRRARKERRNVFLTYTSTSNVQVCTHIELRIDGGVCLHMTMIDQRDIVHIQTQDVKTRNTQPAETELNHVELLGQTRRKIEIALEAADVVLWEFNVTSGLFYSNNEPMNNYDPTKPFTIDEYITVIHPDQREEVRGIVHRMSAGEDFAFNIDAKVFYPNWREWQYCSLSGSPYERSAEDGRILKYVGARKNNTVLHKRRQLQDKILNSIPMAIYMKDVSDDHRYVFCNEESKRLLGIDTDKRTCLLMDRESVLRMQKSDLEVHNTGAPYFGLERMSLQDGRTIDMLVQKSIVEDDGKRLLLGVQWDQSLENDLKRQSKLFSLTLDAINAFTWFYEPDEQRVTFGEGFANVGKQTADVNTLSGFASCIHPDDRKPFAESLGEAVRNNSTAWRMEYRFDVNGDGQYTWWEAKGIVETAIMNNVPYKYMFGMTISIEEHKQIELTLTKNKEELSNLIRQNELILNNTNSGLAYISTDYVVQWENVSTCSTLFKPGAYGRGKLCFQSAHDRSEPCSDCVMQRAIMTRKMERVEYHLREDQSVVEALAVPIFREDGSIDGVVLRIDDITERTHMIAELHKAKALAEQSDKLKSAFLANMSHEIRTPLNAIVGFSELMTEAINDSEKKEYRNIINNNNELLLKLINDILDLSKIEAGSVEFVYEQFDLAEYFNAISMSMYRRSVNPQVKMTTVSPYRKCIVELDRNRVAQLMTNYVTNAIKYTPEGFIQMGYECVNGGIRLYVQDSGIGISADKIKQVFHRFAKLDEFAQGTGLGLSICKAIAESMGGNVGFETKCGEGSTFWAFLPCKPVFELA